MDSSFGDCTLSAKNTAPLVTSIVGQLSIVRLLTAIVAETLALQMAAPIEGAIVIVIVHGR